MGGDKRRPPPTADPRAARWIGSKTGTASSKRPRLADPRIGGGQGQRAAADLNNRAVSHLEHARPPEEVIGTLEQALRCARRAHDLLERRMGKHPPPPRTLEASRNQDLDLDQYQFSSAVSFSPPPPLLSPPSCPCSCSCSCSSSCSRSSSTSSSSSTSEKSPPRPCPFRSQSGQGGSACSATASSNRIELDRGLPGPSGLTAYTRPLLLEARPGPIDLRILPSDDDDDDDDDEQSSQRMRADLEALISRCRRDLAAILFNIALVHHVQGCKTASEASFHKALTTYSISHSIFCQSRLGDTNDGERDEDKDSDTDDAEVSDNRLSETHLLNISLLNNLGQVMSELGQHALATQYFDAISRLLDDHTCSSVKRCWHGFETNVLHSLSHPSPAA